MRVLAVSVARLAISILAPPCALRTPPSRVASQRVQPRQHGAPQLCLELRPAWQEGTRLWRLGTRCF